MNSKNNSLTKPSKPFKDDLGRWFTGGLFWERWVLQPDATKVIAPVFTISVDKPGLINARKTFVELDDPTGYQWCMKYLGDWAHWKRLEKERWFQEALAEWRDELRIKHQSEAIQMIKAAQESGDKNALVAAKYLAEYGWEKRGSGRGRPSKAEVQGELKRQAESVSAEDEDIKRIGLVK